MILPEDQIMLELKRQYNLVIEKYGADRIVGIFASGIVNYGIAENIREINSIVAYVPDFEELCLAKPFKNEQFTEQIFITDIRNEYDMANNQNEYFMEPMFTDYYILNPKYEIPVMQLRERAEEIFHYNPRKRVNYAAQAGLKALKKKDIVNAARLNYAIGLYLAGTPCEYCIKIQDSYIRNFLLAIKNGNYTPNLEDLEDCLYGVIDQAPECDNQAIISFVKARLLDIGRIAMTKGRNALLVLESLTATERKAFTAIAKEIDCAEGNIVISHLTKDLGISRPVFNSLLSKLSTENIIKVENQGVKGTFIKILDYTVQEAMKREV